MKMITKTKKVLERDSLKIIGRLGMETMIKEDCRLYVIILTL